MSIPNTALQPAAQPKNEVSFIPFGAEEEIRLNVTIIRKFVAIKTRSGKEPTDEDCIKFMMLCRSRRLNPFEGDCFLQGYDGREGAQFSLITAHQAFLKRAEVHHEFDGMISGVIVLDGKNVLVEREGDFMLENDTLVGGWAVVYFKQRKYPMKRKLNLSTFKKPYGRWNDDPAGMIVKCAEADALRSSFPTMLGGLYSKEESMPSEAQSVIAAPAMPGPKSVQRAQPPIEVNVAPAPVKPAAKATSAPVPEPTKPASEPQEQNAPPSTPEPAETLPTATQQAATAPPEPSQTPSEPSEPANSADQQTPVAPADPVAAVRNAIGSLGIPEKQLMRYLQSLKPPMARGTQNSLDQLADAKLTTILGQLENEKVVEAISATAV